MQNLKKKPGFEDDNATGKKEPKALKLKVPEALSPDAEKAVEKASKPLSKREQLLEEIERLEKECGCGELSKK